MSEEISVSSHIAVKRMGEFDGGLFLEAMKKKYMEDEAEVRAANMCSLWEHYIKEGMFLFNLSSVYTNSILLCEFISNVNICKTV